MLLWFFAFAGFAHLALVVFTTLADAEVKFGKSHLGLSGYLWLLIGCFALAFVFAGPRRRSPR